MDNQDDLLALAKWALGRRATGASSICMARHMLGMPTDGSYPIDGGDFGRCEGLLDAVPSFRARLYEMAHVNAYWAALVLNWETIRTASDRYEAIKTLLRPMEDKDRGFIRLGSGASIRFGSPD